MDCKYGAVHDWSQPPPRHSPYPPSAVFHERSQGGGGGFMRTVPKAEREAFQREVEKEQIRREIVAEEMARRRELELEVKRELDLESEMSLELPPPRLAAFQDRFNLRFNSVAIEDMPQPCIMDPAEIKPASNQNQLQERVNLRMNPKSNQVAMEAEIKPNNNQDHLQNRVNLQLNPKSNQVAIDDPQPQIIDLNEIKPNDNQDHFQERKNLRWNPKLNMMAIEDMPQPLFMDATEIEPNNTQDHQQERVNLRLNPKSNQVAIEDPQRRIMDCDEIKPNNNQDHLQEQVNLWSNPKLIQVDMPQPCIDPAEIEPNNNQDQQQERVNQCLNPKSNQVGIEDMPQPRTVDCAEIKPTKSQIEVFLLGMNLRQNPKLNQVAIEDMPQPQTVDPAEVKLTKNQDEVIIMGVNLHLNPESNEVAIEDMPPPRTADPVEIKPTNNQDEVVLQAKPDPDRCDAKRKAMEPAVSDSADSQLKKKPKKEWRCALCGVSATNEVGLNVHLRGRKHKHNAREAALRAEITGIQAHQLSGEGSMTQNNVDTSAVEAQKEEQVVLKSHNIGVSEINEVTTEAAGKEDASLKRELWCDICGVSTPSLQVMEGHKVGRKHRRRMEMAASQNKPFS